MLPQRTPGKVYREAVLREPTQELNVVEYMRRQDERSGRDDPNWEWKPSQSD
jgi:hypothetical protein